MGILEDRGYPAGARGLVRWLAELVGVVVLPVGVAVAAVGVWLLWSVAAGLLVGLAVAVAAGVLAFGFVKAVAGPLARVVRRGRRPPSAGPPTARSHVRVLPGPARPDGHGRTAQRRRSDQP